eukprot:m.17755 g.17755  ORF g.17755 m.17755 type:complete len:297 (+) comp11306_c0_seq2:333-1223(+)
MPLLDSAVKYTCMVAVGYILALYTVDHSVEHCAKVKVCTRDDNSGESMVRSELASSVQLATTHSSVSEEGHFDFIEIGTSNFETLIEKAPERAKGLSVEGLKMYQDQLPDRTNVIKVNAAISNPSTGAETIKFFYIHPNDITKHRLPAWLIGCNAAGKPQTEAARILANRNLTHLMRVDDVPVLSFEGLARKYNVRTIGFLKIDVEGHEAIILRSMMTACSAQPAMWPRVINFEHKHVKGYDQRDLVSTLATHGYTVVAYTNGEHKDFTLVRVGDGALSEVRATDPSIRGGKAQFT